MTAALLVLCCAAGQTLVSAPETDRDLMRRAQTLVESGESHYALGEFDAAIGELKEAYRLVPRPGLLFNLAQCYAQKNEWELAAFSYRAYLRAAPDAGNRALVEELILDADNKAGQARAQVGSNVVWIGGLTLGVSSTVVVVAASAGALAVEGFLLSDAGDGPTREGASWARTGLIVVAGVAGAVGAVAIVVGALAEAGD